MKSKPATSSDLRRIVTPTLLGLLILTLIFALPLLSSWRTGPAAKFYGLPATDISAETLPALGFRDDRGHRIKRANFQGKFVFLYFGYTRCQDSCPAWLGRLLSLTQRPANDATSTKRTGKAPGPADIHVLFVSIDPRDNAEHLRGYVGDRRNFTAIPAGQREIFTLADRLGYRFDRAAREADDLARHADAVYLFDREGRLRLFYPYRWLDPTRLKADLELLDSAAHPDPRSPADS